MKGSDQPPRNAKKGIVKKTVKATAFTSEFVAKVGRQINDRWPNLGGQLASLLRLSREKIDDLYSYAAQTMSEHKEAFDDRRAARKAQERIETRATPEAAPGRRAARARTANGSVVTPRPKRTPSTSNPSSSKSRS